MHIGYIHARTSTSKELTPWSGCGYRWAKSMNVLSLSAKVPRIYDMHCFNVSHVSFFLSFCNLKITNVGKL